MLRNISLIPLFLAAPVAAEHAFEDRDPGAGAALYAEHCAACHGANLEGQPDWQTPNEDGTLPAPPHDASGHTWHHDSGLLFAYTKLGGAEALAEMGVQDFPSGMPGFADVLTDDDIWDILAYIRSTWPEDLRAFQTTRTPGHE